MITTDARVAALLTQYVPSKILGLLEEHGIQIKVLPAHENPELLDEGEMVKASSTWRESGDHFPEGVESLFMPDERTVYCSEGTLPFALIHEVGHALEFSLQAYYPNQRMSETLSFNLLSDVADVQGLRYPTMYATESPVEYFAEAFAIYTKTPATLAAEGPVVPKNVPTALNHLFNYLATGMAPDEAKRKALVEAQTV